MLGIINFYEFILGTIFIIILPGPNSMYVLAVAAKNGIKQGYFAALGVFLGDMVLIVSSILGAATLLKAFPSLFLTIKVIGALYLAYLGSKMLFGAYQLYMEKYTHRTKMVRSEPEHERSHDLNEIKRSVNNHFSSPFVKALLISLVNPKAILFFISFFIQFVAADAENPFLAFMLLGLAVQLCSFVYLSTLIFAGSSLAALFRAHPAWMISGTVGVGLLFILFGFRLIMASL